MPLWPGQPGRCQPATDHSRAARKPPVTSAYFAATHIDADASFAIDQLSDISAVGRWALGSMDFVATAQPGVWRGQSLFDGSACFVQITSHPALGLIDYLVGSLDDRGLRVSVRVVPAASGSGCTAAMTTWRAANLGDADWARSCRAHDVEVLLFKAQIETAWTAPR